jgi:TRAP-type uncharacterized transport system substrate-binding protein
MKSKILLALATAALMVACKVDAQQLKVAAGAGVDKSTYSRMFGELTSVCSMTTALVEVNTQGGSIENLDKLVNNEVNAAIVQWDVLWLRAQQQDLGSIKTLFTLHPEEVHVVARNEVIKEGGIAGFGSKEIVLKEVNDLAGRTVGATGGSYVTAKSIKLLTEVNFNLREFNNAGEVLKALAAKQIDAAIMVGGSPLPAVAGLGTEYKLLTFSDGVKGKLKGVYNPASLSYSKMSASSVPSVATEAIFVTRDYKTARFVKSLTDLRACLNKNLPELQETTGMHPKWQVVNVANRGKWAVYEPAGK